MFQMYCPASYFAFVVAPGDEVDVQDFLFRHFPVFSFVRGHHRPKAGEVSHALVVLKSRLKWIVFFSIVPFRGGCQPKKG